MDAQHVRDAACPQVVDSGLADVYGALKRGEAALVATDTVYGLAALPASEGEREIYRLKRRPEDQRIAWLVSGLDMAARVSDGMTGYARRLARALWPGALTLVVACDRRTLALRCPDDAACIGLIEALGSPLACTSANLHGQPTPASKDEMPQELRTLPGFAELPETCGSTASTIVDCTGRAPRILREGPITARTVYEAAGFDDKLI